MDANKLHRSTQFPPERIGLLYRLVRSVGRVILAIFFKKIDVRNSSAISPTGPVLFVANHPNSIMDAFVLGVAIPRKVNYIGHAGLFSNPWSDRFLKSVGVIPVVRQGESSDKLADNTSSFEACYKALEEGQTIGIFPEGTSDMLRQVKRVRTGAARILLEAESRNGYQLGIRLVPLGLHFFSRSRFRSRVMINIGDPVELDSFFVLHQSDAAGAVQALTSRIQSEMEKLTVNINFVEYDELVRDVETIFRDELMNDPNRQRTATDDEIEKFVITQRIADCVNHFAVTDPDRVRRMQSRIDMYKRKLAYLHLRDSMLHERAGFSRLILQSGLKLIVALLGLPIALYGIVHNFFPHAITLHVAKKFLHERTKILTALLFAGGPSFLLFYSLQTFLVQYFFGSTWAVLYLVSLPLTGLFASAYVRDLRQDQELISFSFVLLTNRHLVNRLRRERKILIEEMNKVRTEYLVLKGL
ncbi:MAG: 1-acyl-sn-glycerol-3-phosphate acyltransferase [Bacteroidetes bacterium]|nr:1-acyl-sn-glycerol-3-phosphate acyltransferase [Bacteroidota bacterium]